MANGNGNGAKALPATGVALTTSAAAAGSGAGAVEFYRWAFDGFHAPVPESVLMTLAVVSVPFAHALGKGLLAAVEHWFPGDTTADTPAAPTAAVQPPNPGAAARPWPEGSAR